MPLREVARRFWPDLRPYRWWLALSLVLAAVAPAIETAVIWLYGLLIDDVLVPADLGALGPIALAYLALTLGGGVVAFASSYLGAWVGERVLLDLRLRVFRHLQALPPAFFERQRLGDVLTRLTDDVDEVESLLVSDGAAALEYALKIVFFTAALAIIDWRLALVALVAIPPSWWAARRFAGRIKRFAREQRRREGAIAAVAEESLANMALVQAYNAQERQLAAFAREVEGDYASQMALERLRAVFTPLIDLLQLAGVLVVVAVGAWDLAHGRLTLGALLAFLAYLSQLYSPVRSLTSLVNDLFAASAGAERIIELLDERPVADRPDARPLLPARGAVAFEGVSFTYPGAAAPALRDISFRMEPGETVALVGASGAGKSTLVKLLLRFVEPDVGRVALDGCDLRDLRARDLRDHLAVVLQETLLLDGTIRDNIAYGRPGASEAEIVAAARAADAHRFITALPEGYDARVGQRGRALSGGQRQRIAIARAMIRDAPVLILDEPTTGLDAATGERVLEPLRRLMAGRTTLVVSHNLLTVRDADRIVVLDRGRVVECGEHEDLLRRGGVYARLYALHARRRGKRPTPAKEAS
ncbi:MAG: ABC transporter ATP-binding protein [Thermomicrobiales bacterium]|nr:ABC transporter ATP-binding protein [Thermomicrobiales bacterium]